MDFDKWWHKNSPKLVSGDWDDDRTIAQAAWEAALRLSAGADWVLVPREPTDDMVIAFAEAWFSKRRPIDDCMMEDCYRAMIEAAPRHEPGEG